MTTTELQAMKTCIDKGHDFVYKNHRELARRSTDISSYTETWITWQCSRCGHEKETKANFIQRWVIRRRDRTIRL